ncbi:MAG: hypothetical protein JG776_2364 [Caloramator sp.]|jgi:hypothetical protein|uniref:hypothetical protein n=1 Tax=Caloramator sp. TaxID=1871330 RepID=UPI001D3DCA0A|nr:hypothetical protein [Caloramator sp.]MBZ4664640.1 hypothetical protein [Caloramator sp.]
MQREERTRRENFSYREFREEKRDFIKEIFNNYKKGALPKIDVLIDNGTVLEGKIIDNIEKNWSILFEEDEVFNRELVETYLHCLKGSYLKYKNGETKYFILEYILIDIVIKRAIIDAESVQDVTVESVFKYIENIINDYRKEEVKGYIDKILKRYNLYSYSKNDVFLDLKKWFKNYEKEITQLFNDIKEKMMELRKNKNNFKYDNRKRQDEVEIKHIENLEIDAKKDEDIEQDDSKELDDIEELKERLNLFELEYKRLNKKIEDLNRALDEQKKNIVAELINTLNEKSFGLVLDRLYMWSFMDAEYDINDIKLYVKNLFRALEKLDVYADNSNLLGIIDLQADEIGTKYRLNKDMGVYSPGYKKVIFPGWKYKDEHIINPMIEV